MMPSAYTAVLQPLECGMCGITCMAVAPDQGIYPAYVLVIFYIFGMN